VYADGTTGIYDRCTDGMVKWHDLVPLVIETTPIRPDGKGFLAARLHKDGEFGVVFIEWDGQEYPLDLKPGALTDGVRELVSAMILLPYFYRSWWEGDVAVVSYSTTLVHLDTATGKGTIHFVDWTEATFEGQVIQQQYTFPGGTTGVRVLETVHPIPDPFNPLVPEEQATYRAYVFKSPGGKESRLIGETNSSFLLLPAPNRKLVAVRGVFHWPGTKPDQDTIAIVNENGDLVDSFIVRMPFPQVVIK
jgi:hypothetical protein